MKKLLAMLLALVMVLSFAACSNEDAPVDENPSSESEAETPVDEDPVDEEPADTAATYTLGMGVHVSTGSSADGNAQVDATVAVVVLDAEGKIVDIEIDCAQTKLNTVEFPDLTTVDVRSKAEKKEDYGMAAVMGVPEWYVQVDALEEVLVGMTAEEVAAIELIEHNGHNVALNDETIYAACTMDLTGFKAAIAKACADEYAKEFTADSFELSLGVLTDVSESTAATADAEGVARLYTNFAGVVTDANGAVLAVLCDMIQPTVNFDATGAITATKEDLRTKKELGFDYNMVTYGGAIAEWFEQTLAVEEYFVGMTAADIEALELYDHNGHMTFEAIVASCTMNVNEFQATVLKALA